MDKEGLCQFVDKQKDMKWTTPDKQAWSHWQEPERVTHDGHILQREITLYWGFNGTQSHSWNHMLEIIGCGCNSVIGVFTDTVDLFAFTTQGSPVSVLRCHHPSDQK